MRSMGTLLVRQLLLIAAITVAVFLLVRVVPGDVVDVLAAEGRSMRTPWPRCAARWGSTSAGTSNSASG